MGKARITYRFDRETPSAAPDKGDFDEASAAEDTRQWASSPLYRQDDEYMRDYGAWKSPYDAEADRIEQLIRHSGAEREADARTDEEHDRVDARAQVAYMRDLPRYTEAGGATYRKKARPSSWVAMSASLAGAILTGVILGAFILSMFRGEAPPDTGQSGSLNGVAATSGEEAPVDSAGEFTDGVAVVGAGVGDGLQSLTLNLPEQTYYFVQFGVFAGREGADTALEQLKAKGLAGAVASSDRYAVFAAAAATRDDALLLSHHLQSEQLEVFIKPFVLPAVGTLLWQSSSISGEQLAAYAAESRALAGLVLSATALGVNEAAASSLAGDALAALKRQHQQWLERANALVGSAPAEKSPLLERLNTALNSAVANLEQFEKKPDSTYLWQAQAQAAEALIAQQQLLSGS